jgi:2-dehydro-3-deoxygluconokinase
MSKRVLVTTLGEAMIVMDPLSKGLLRHVDTFVKRVGGAELNVAVALSRLGHRAAWAGDLGDDEFGEEVRRFLRGEGVDVSGVGVNSEAPTGVYFKERRALDRLRVYYYRAGSAASKMGFEDLNMDYLLSGEVLHLTGITPALSESCRDLTERLIYEANERGVTVSFDANVRWRLFKGVARERCSAPSPPAPTCCCSQRTRLNCSWVAATRKISRELEKALAPGPW